MDQKTQNSTKNSITQRKTHGLGKICKRMCQHLLIHTKNGTDVTILSQAFFKKLTTVEKTQGLRKIKNKAC